MNWLDRRGLTALRAYEGAEHNLVLLVGMIVSIFFFDPWPWLYTDFNIKLFLHLHAFRYVRDLGAFAVQFLALRVPAPSNHRRSEDNPWVLAQILFGGLSLAIIVSPSPYLIGPVFLAACCAPRGSVFSLPRTALRGLLACGRGARGVLQGILVFAFLVQQPLLVVFVAFRVIHAFFTVLCRVSKSGRRLLQRLALRSAFGNAMGTARVLAGREEACQKQLAREIRRRARIWTTHPPPFDPIILIAYTNLLDETSGAALALQHLPLPALLAFQFHLRSIRRAAFPAGQWDVPRPFWWLERLLEQAIAGKGEPVGSRPQTSFRARLTQDFLPWWFSNSPALQTYIHLLDTLALSLVAALLAVLAPGSASSFPQPDPNPLQDFRHFADLYLGYSYTILSPYEPWEPYFTQDPTADPSIRRLLQSLAALLDYGKTLGLTEDAIMDHLEAQQGVHVARAHLQKTEDKLLDAVLEAVLRWKEIREARRHG